MSVLTRSSHSANRDEVRARTHGARRFHPVEPSGDAGQPPVEDQDFESWPGPDRPTGPNDSHLQWPYWIVLLVPWLTLTAAFLLEHFKVCLICLGGNVSIPGGL